MHFSLMSPLYKVVTIFWIYAIGYVRGNDSWLDLLCDRIPQHTTVSKTVGDNGFEISVVDKPQPDGYIPGVKYRVRIHGKYGNETFRGFMLSVVPFNSQKVKKSLGNFQHLESSEARFLGCKGREVVTQDSLSYLKRSVTLSWIAPRSGSGCVAFKVTLIKEIDKWYKDDGRLTFVFCEEGQRDGTNVRTADHCCACGYATYRFVFVNNWKRQNHPKDYPSPMYKSLMHWSNLIGASHSNNFKIWSYGQYASDGVRQVCEFGYPNTVERTLKDHKLQSKDIRTVIKTTFMNDLSETREVRVTVDKSHPLFSFLTMLGPSPDWCTGVDSYNFCNKNCTWKGNHIIYLYPWDAGTDSGITYLSRNSKTVPKEKITPITNEYPNSADSPFFGKEKIEPVAKLHVTRLTPQFNDDRCISDDKFDVKVDKESSPSTEELLVIMKEKMKHRKMLEEKKCATSEWKEWTACSVTCGIGIRRRTRYFLNPLVTKDMCSHQLTSSKTCVGATETCQSIRNVKKSYRDSQGLLKPNSRKKYRKFKVDYEEAPELSDICAVTPWSEWSPCSVTCGVGHMERRRMYMQKIAVSRCRKSLLEKKACSGHVIDCRKATMMKDYTKICIQNKDPGPCRGRFRLWYYDSNIRQCYTFIYGGCRGNENRFYTYDECVKLCEHHMENIIKEDMRKEKHVTDEDQLHKELMGIKLEMSSLSGRHRKEETKLNRQLTQLMQMYAVSDSFKRNMLSSKISNLKNAIMTARAMFDKKQRMLSESIREKMKQLNVLRNSKLDVELNMKKNRQMLHLGKNKDGDLSKKLAMIRLKEMEKLNQMKLKEMEKRRRENSKKMLTKHDNVYTKHKKGIGKKRKLLEPHPPLIFENRRVSHKNGQKNNLKPSNKNKFLQRSRKIKMRTGKRKFLRGTRKSLKNKRKRKKGDCFVTRWTRWSKCSVTCGVGVSSKRRSVKKWHKPGGRKCPRLVRVKKCQIRKCPSRKAKKIHVQRDTPRINCQATAWTSWTPCSVTCGKGQRIKTRTIKVRPSSDGRRCPKKLKRRRVCRLPKCRLWLKVRNSALYRKVWLRHAYPYNTQAVDCQMSNWTPWSHCSMTCGSSVTKERTRTILSPERNGGQPCGPDTERIPCKLPPCHIQYDRNSKSSKSQVIYT